MSFSFETSLDPVALLALSIAAASLVWQIVSRFLDRPKLRVRVTPNAQLDAAYGDATFILVIVSNIGNRPTTIHPLYTCYWPTLTDKICRRKRSGQVVNAHPLLHSAPKTIGPGEIFLGGMVQTDAVKEMAVTGRFYVEVSHSYSNKPIRVRVRFWQPRENASHEQDSG